MEEEPSNSLIEKEVKAAEDDGFSLIDGSSVDDLFFSVSGMDNNLSILDGLTMLETPQAEMPRRKEIYNLRKSLAWDSAFFTSAGVLDAHELSCIIEESSGRRKKMLHLPGIQEHMSKSADSLSTLQSDDVSLESLETNLFCDMRGSNQKSHESSSHLRKPNSNGGQQKTEAGYQPRTKTIPLHQGNMVKPNSATKLSTGLKGDGKPLKLGLVHEQVKKPLGSRMNPCSSLLKTPAPSQRGSLIMMVPSKVSTKRTAAAAGRVKSETNNAQNATGRATTVSKGPGPGDNNTIVPKTSSYAKSSSGSSATHRTGIARTRSSFDSTSSSSVSSRPLPHNGLRGKTMRTVSVPPPGSKSKIPSRVPLKGNSQPGSPRISGCLSRKELSPSVSPTSSRSDWSSSSSTATFSQERNFSKDHLNLRRTLSLDRYPSDDSDMHPNLHTSCEYESELAGVPNGSTYKSLAGNGCLSNPVSAKASGLRMPSPKIGFFDGVKTVERTPNVASRLHSLSDLPSSRFRRSTIGSSSPSGASNKGSTGRPVAKAYNSDPDTQRSNNARMNPAVGGRLGRKPITPEKASSEKASKDVSKATSVKISEEKITAAVKLQAGEEWLSEPGSSSKRRIGLVSNVLNPHVLHELSYGGTEVGSAVTVDDGVAVAVDPISIVIKDQQDKEAADPPEKTDFFVSSENSEESDLVHRSPYADMISLSDANALEILVKGFNSLSLDNLPAKDVETETA